ncbi:MAG: arylsulfatase [Chloroflexota bacterium]
MNKPNIIYILADDMGYGDMACNNPDSKIPTPNLNRLAEQGMRFTDAHAPSSVCTPTRYALMTGRYCWRTPLKSGVLWPWDPPLIEPDRLTVAELLRQNGYRTACIGKWHLGWEWATLNGEPAHQSVELGVRDVETRQAVGETIDYNKPMRGGPIDNGFDSYFGVDVPNFPPYTWFEQDRVTDPPTIQKPDTMFGDPGRMKQGWQLEEMIPELVRRAVDFIEEAADDRESGVPFFLYFPLTSPHTPIVPNQQFIGSSGAGLYGDFVCEVDWVVGEVMSALERKGMVDNTLLIFTSDNGPECIPAAAGGCYEVARQYDHYSMAEFRGAKRDTWEGGHRIPFIARWPGVTPAGTVCNQLTILADLIATCAQLLEVDLPQDAGEDSISILPLLTGQATTPVRSYAVHHSGSGRFAIRKDNWVFIDAPSGDDNGLRGNEMGEPRWFKTARGYTPHDHPGELFNVYEDAAEKTNLYGEQPEIVEELAQILEQIKITGEARESHGKSISE